MKWKVPPRAKVPEALGCIADGRIEIEGNEGKVYSSSGNKFYTITYDAAKREIMCNDNASYWVGYLGYPSIAFLMLKGVIVYDKKTAEAFKDIKWKDINQRYKNDFEKALQEILKNLASKGYDRTQLEKEISAIYTQVELLNFNLLGAKTKPPVGY